MTILAKCLTTPGADLQRDHSRRPGGGVKVLAVLCLLAFGPSVLAAGAVTLLGLFENKALFHIDGSRRMLATGQVSPEGVRLISADTEQAVVEINGRREVLGLGMATVYPDSAADIGEVADDESSVVALWADGSGSFYADGSINGYPVRFLVDTGATTVAVSGDLARRVGIDTSKGKAGMASTAGGPAPMVSVTLDSVAVGGITMRDVRAGVLIGSSPQTPLLGMSFLNKLDMVRKGRRLELKTRY